MIRYENKILLILLNDKSTLIMQKDKNQVATFASAKSGRKTLHHVCLTAWYSISYSVKEFLYSSTSKNLEKEFGKFCMT